MSIDTGSSATRLSNLWQSYFVNDDWRVSNRLTLNIGMRYDYFGGYKQADDKIVNITQNGYIVGTQFDPKTSPWGSSLIRPDRNNWGPRFGFAYRPGFLNEAVIRGGYGKFFDKVVLGTTATFLSQSIYTPSFTAAFPTSSADPGPSAGRLPTDPFLANGPVVNRALLNAMFPSGSVGRNTGTVYIDNPDRVVPNLHQVTLGYELWRRFNGFPPVLQEEPGYEAPLESKEQN